MYVTLCLTLQAAVEDTADAMVEATEEAVVVCRVMRLIASQIEADSAQAMVAAAVSTTVVEVNPTAVEAALVAMTSRVEVEAGGKPARNPDTTYTCARQCQ